MEPILSEIQLFPVDNHYRGAGNFFCTRANTAKLSISAIHPGGHQIHRTGVIEPAAKPSLLEI